MTLLYLDCSSGISGDMLLGALCEASGGLDELAGAISALGVAALSVRSRDVVRAGIGATKIDILVNGQAGPDPGLLDAPGSRGSRSLAEIRSIISSSGLSEGVKERSMAVFARLVGAEAEVHRVRPEKVRLHEAGALDAIADVVGCVALMSRIAPERVVASPVNVGGGTLECEHGIYPVPGPATSLLLRGVPMYSSGPGTGELATPTGAALLTAFAHEYGPMPLMRATRIGAGAGQRDTAPRPNILRAFLGEAGAGSGVAPSNRDDAGGAEEGEVIVLECTIDDMNPQNYAYLMERLQACGALEVFFTPVQMKKNRPGILVTVLGAEEHREALISTLFAETTTIGLRCRRETRRELDRRWEQVETAHGAVRVKVSGEGRTVRSAQPEFEDCRRLAARLGVPIKEVQAAAIEAWRTSHRPAARARGGRSSRRRAAAPRGKRRRRA